MLDPLLRIFPLWVVGLLLVVLCLLAREAGAYLYTKLNRHRIAAGEDKIPEAESYIVAPIFGLLAFVLGITFSIALDRFDTRRGLVAEEATAISTVYLRASLFDEPQRSILQGTIREYAHTRIAPEGVWDETVQVQVDHSRALRQRLWDETHDAVYPVRETELASYFVDAMNEALTVGTRRELSGRAHIPTRIVELLILYAIISGGVLGYLLGGSPGRKRQAATALFFLLGIMFVTILDIDRPRAGAIQVPQRALEELVRTLDQDAARAQAPPR